MKLKNLQLLRGISAILVCCFHFKDALNFDQNLWGNTLFSKGSIGVPIFFVISSYIRVFSTKKIDHSEHFRNIVSFYKKRIIRILPLYYLLTLFWMILGGSILYYLQKENVGRLLYSLLFLPQKNNFPVLYLGWSLNYEMFFYFIFALSLLFKNYRYFVIILFFMISLMIGKLFSPENIFLQMITGILNIYFIIGVLLGLFLHKTPNNRIVLIAISAFSIVLLYCTFLTSFRFLVSLSLLFQSLYLFPHFLFLIYF